MSKILKAAQIGLEEAIEVVTGKESLGEATGKVKEKLQDLADENEE